MSVIKRIKDAIEWCDNVQNNSNESQSSKDEAKRITYDQIRKIVKESEGE